MARAGKTVYKVSLPPKVLPSVTIDSDADGSVGEEAASALEESVR